MVFQIKLSKLFIVCMKTESCVKIDAEEKTTWFKIKTGVRQGCILSPLLFIIVIDFVLNQALKDQEMGIRLNFRKVLQDLDFADDIVLVSDDFQKMQEKTNRIDTCSKAVGLNINIKKTEILVVNEEKFMNDSEHVIEVRDQKLQNVDNFTYLGSKISKEGDIMVELNTRIGKAIGALKKFNKIWKNKSISIKTKMKLYRANVVSVLIYGCETWQLTEHQEDKLNAFDYNCLRKIMKISWKDKVTNEEVRRKANIPPVTQIIRKQRLSWFGHVIRMDRDRLAKNIINWEPPYSEAKRGRPQTSWKDTIKRDLRELNLEYDEAITIAKNKKEWLRLLLPIAPNGDWSNR